MTRLGVGLRAVTLFVLRVRSTRHYATSARTDGVDHPTWQRSLYGRRMTTVTGPHQWLAESPRIGGDHAKRLDRRGCDSYGARSSWRRASALTRRSHSWSLTQRHCRGFSAYRASYRVWSLFAARQRLLALLDLAHKRRVGHDRERLLESL